MRYRLLNIVEIHTQTHLFFAYLYIVMYAVHLYYEVYNRLHCTLNIQ